MSIEGFSSSVIKLFREHPNSKGMTYIQHLFSALLYTGLSLCAALAFLVHSILPFLFKTTGSTLIENLNTRLQSNPYIPSSQPFHVKISLQRSDELVSKNDATNDDDNSSDNESLTIEDSKEIVDATEKKEFFVSSVSDSSSGNVDGGHDDDDDDDDDDEVRLKQIEKKVQ